MSSKKESFTIGVEEEYQIIHPDTYELSSSSSALLPTAQKNLGEKAQPELQLSQVEAATPVLACRPLWNKPRVNRCGGSTRTPGSNPDRENARMEDVVAFMVAETRRGIA